MPVTNTSNISKDIKNGRAASLYYFYGHDVASIESYVRWMINKLCPKDAQFMNFHKFEGKKLDIPSLVDACEALPMFADRVVIAINDLRMEDIGKEDGDALRRILSKLSETTTVIIYATGVDLYKNKRSLTDKNKRFCDHCAKYGEVCDFAYKTSNELGRSIAAAFQKNGCGIDRRDSEYLAEICGCDSAYIKQEIDKLSAYASGRTVTREDIDVLCVKHIESDGYELAVNILNNNAKFVYNKLFELANQDHDAFEIVSIIGFSLTDIYRAKLARSSGLNYKDACEDFNYPKNREFAIKKAYQICGSISVQKIKDVIKIMSATDLTLKTTSLDKKAAMLVLEQRVAECFMSGSGRGGEMDRIKLKQAVVVEGKYDKITLSQVIDAVIITTDGFGIYKNDAVIKLIQMYASSVGLVILTDSDTAGQQIRGRIKSLVGDAEIINVYCPVIQGKEKRKLRPSKEGNLGVEGMSVEVLRAAFEKAGLTGDDTYVREPVTKQDMIVLGLNGSPNSSRLREAVAVSLGLPAKLSSNSLRDAVSTLMGRSAFIEYIKKLKGEEE